MTDRVFPLAQGTYSVNGGGGVYGAPRPSGPHSGQDYGAPAGTTIYAAQGGTVVVASRYEHSIWGYYVEIRHGGGYRTLYAHMVRPPRVSVGDTVEAGTPIGQVGNSGYSFGNHLHLTVYRPGGGTVDPRVWLSGVPHVGSGARVGKVTGSGPVDSGDTPDKEKSRPLPKPQRREEDSGLSLLDPEAGRFRLTSGLLTSDTARLIQSVSLEARSEQVAQVTLASYDDPDLTLSRSALASPGAALVWSKGRVSSEWDLSAAQVKVSDSSVKVAARSTLARRLRRQYPVVGTHKVRADEWVRRTVVGAGGRAVCQRAPVRTEVPAGKDQTEWDVLKSLASDLGWSFVEYGGTVWFGSKWWAWSGGAGLPEWSITWDTSARTDLIDADLSKTEDNADYVAGGTIEVPWSVGSEIRPWHTITLSGLGVWDGSYLVDAVLSELDGTSPVTLEVLVPHKAADPVETADGPARSPAPPTKDKRTPQYAKWYARQLMARAPYNWGSEDQWRALEQLWTRESGWNYRAKNPSSGAYGIPQSLPASKMASAGADYLTNPETQIKWGLSYIKGRYGGPLSARAFFQRNNWY